MNCLDCGNTIGEGQGCVTCESLNYVPPISMDKGLDPKGAAGLKKPQLQLIPPIFNVEVAKALQNGNQKYGPWNWRNTNVELMTYIGAMKRHIDAVLNGEDTDLESGADHLGHAAACCAIVLDARQCGTLVDNRPTPPK